MFPGRQNRAAAWIALPDCLPTLRGMKTSPTTPTKAPADLTPLERRRKIPVSEAAAMNSLSESSFRRHHKHLIRKVSARRDAVALGDALDLPPKPAT